MGLSKLFLLDSKIVNVLETKNLLLSQVLVSDGPFILELLNSPSWLKYIGDRGVKDLNDAKHYIKYNIINSYQDHGFGLYKITLKESGEALGLCGLLKRDYLDYPDLGFALMPQHERQGYGHEAAQLIMHFAEEQLGCSKLYAITSKDNGRSQKLLQKLGFSAQGSVNNPEGQTVSLFQWAGSDV